MQWLPTAAIDDTICTILVSTSFTSTNMKNNEININNVCVIWCKHSLVKAHIKTWACASLMIFVIHFKDLLNVYVSFQIYLILVRRYSDLITDIKVKLFYNCSQPIFQQQKRHIFRNFPKYTMQYFKVPLGIRIPPFENHFYKMSEKQRTRLSPYRSMDCSLALLI